MEEKKVVQILGPYYSGSTLLCAILNKHPECFAAGQMFHIGRYIFNWKEDILCMCNEELNVICPFWQEVVDNFDGDIYDAICKVSNKRIVIDNSKYCGYVEPFMDGIRDSIIYVIHLTKSPERYVASRLRHGIETTIDYSADMWLEHNQMVLDFCDKHNIANVFNLRYIDLVTDIKTKMREICDFIGIGYVDGMENYWELEEQPHMLGGNNLPLSFFNPNNRYAKMMSRSAESARYHENYRKIFVEKDYWKDYITPEQYDKIWNREDIQDMAERLGFEKDEM